MFVCVFVSVCLVCVCGHECLHIWSKGLDHMATLDIKMYQKVTRMCVQGLLLRLLHYVVFDVCVSVSACFCVCECMCVCL